MKNHYKTQEDFNKDVVQAASDPSAEKKSRNGAEYSKEVAQGSSCSIA